MQINGLNSLHYTKSTALKKNATQSISFKARNISLPKNEVRYFDTVLQNSRKAFQNTGKKIRTLKYKIEDFLFEIFKNECQIEKQERNVNGENRVLKIVDGMQYSLFSKEGKKLGEMEVGIDSIEQLWCESDFYKKSKKPSLAINRLYSKSPGMGSFFIKEAVKKSNQMGYRGRVITYALDIEPERGTPVPFYYKKGFCAFKPEIQKKIELGMENLKNYGEYTGPKTALMYLPQEKIAQYLKN